MARRATVLMMAGALLIVLVAGVAVARTFQCGDRAYPCEGTNNDDIISERQGKNTRDDISALDGEDVVRAQLFGNDNDIVNTDQENDFVRANDGDNRDSIDCGEGPRDRVVVDEGDAVNFSNCERVQGQSEDGPTPRMVAGAAVGDGLNEAVPAE